MCLSKKIFPKAAYSQMQISLKKVRKFLSENVASRIILNISYTSIQLLWIHYHAVMESSK